MRDNPASLPRSFDPIWEDEIYSQERHLNRWPFDIVVSFLFRNRPQNKPHGEVRILEVGCGAGNNLWCAAREGFQAFGIDGSRNAIIHARKRFEQEGLEGEFMVGDFTKLPFEDCMFDLAIDRGALTCTGLAAAQAAISEVKRVLQPGGRFLFNPYCIQHSSASHGEAGPDGLTLRIRTGTLINVGQICFYDRARLSASFDAGWKLLSQEHLEIRNETLTPTEVHAEWRVVAEKV